MGQPVFMTLNTQTELEHRNPKSLYTRTSRKQFEKQLAKMERMQARVRRIRRKVDQARESELQPDEDPVPESLAVKYHIGKTQNNPIDLGPFLHEYRDDPAVSVVLLLNYPFISLSVSSSGFCAEPEGSPAAQGSGTSPGAKCAPERRHISSVRAAE